MVVGVTVFRVLLLVCGGVVGVTARRVLLVECGEDDSTGVTDFR